MPRKQTTNLAGHYPLSVSVADWDTGEVVEVAGELHVRHKDTTGYDWCWRFEVHDPSQGRASSSCSGRTLVRFIQAASANELVSVPREQIEAALRDIKPLRNFVERVLAGEDLDGEQLEKARDLSVLNSEQQRQVAEDQRREGMNAEEKQKDEALREINGAIGEKDLNKLLLVCRKIGVNTGFKKYTWHGVYTQETPLSLVAKANWKEGVMALLEDGAMISSVIAETDSRGRTRYHDFSALGMPVPEPKSTSTKLRKASTES
jgi:hypothetical protein